MLYIFKKTERMCGAACRVHCFINKNKYLLLLLATLIYESMNARGITWKMEKRDILDV
jgi:hypothetical protein